MIRGVNQWCGSVMWIFRNGGASVTWNPIDNWLSSNHIVEFARSTKIIHNLFFAVIVTYDSYGMTTASKNYPQWLPCMFERLSLKIIKGEYYSEYSLEIQLRIVTIYRVCILTARTLVDHGPKLNFKKTEVERVKILLDNRMERLITVTLFLSSSSIVSAWGYSANNL